MLHMIKCLPNRILEGLLKIWDLRTEDDFFLVQLKNAAVFGKRAAAIKTKDFFQLFLLFLTMVLCSSGIEGGTGSPEILSTAPKRGGQTSKQVPHLIHLS